MKKLTFRNGDELDILGLGTWKSKPGEVGQAIRSAIKIGYRHFDCAFIYMNEKEIGQAFADAFAAGDVKRERGVQRVDGRRTVRGFTRLFRHGMAPARDTISARSVLRIRR